MENGKLNILSDEELLEKLKEIEPLIEEVKQYFTDTKNPICVIKFKKEKIKNNLRIVVFTDTNEIDNPYMLVWRVTNNIDALRDVWIDEIIGIDVTNKNKLDGFKREWPPDVDVDQKVIEKLQKLGLIEGISEEELRKYQIT
nr:hypothetical protein [Lebetimonas sp. JS032]